MSDLAPSLSTRPSTVRNAAHSADVPPLRPGPDEPPIRISLAQWSIRELHWNGGLDPLDFPRASAERWGIHGVEYVNGFFKDRVGDEAWVAQLRKRADDHGVRSLLIMCDGLGRLGDPDAAARREAVLNHQSAIDAVVQLGGHSIRVNAGSAGERDEQARLAADGLRQLCELAEPSKINVIVENHGGWSSDGSWLAEVMRRVDHPRIGTLPDFGNFNLGGGRTYDPYRGVQELMPWARAVSAKSRRFNDAGDEIDLDYRILMGTVLDSGYRGWVGIEYEGGDPDGPAGVMLTKALIERVLAERGVPVAAAGERVAP
ncbi:MAG: sugar phosphate isomerase/epimerase family protein [Phycisphaerales bacterium]